jgi:ankyrin repeat protein
MVFCQCKRAVFLHYLFVDVICFRYLAIEHGMQEVVSLFLQRGVDVNQSVTRVARDMTPLHMALLHKHYHLVSLFLRRGADVNLVEFKRGLTPLLLAVVLQDELGVRLLAPHRPDPSLFNSQGRNCLFVAAETGNSSILQLLVSHWDLDVNTSTDRMGHTALHVACMFDKAHTVHCLLQLGASVTAVDTQGRTPLDIAREGSSFAAEAVLMEFARIREENNDAWTGEDLLIE